MASGALIRRFGLTIKIDDDVLISVYFVKQQKSLCVLIIFPLCKSGY